MRIYRVSKRAKIANIIYSLIIIWSSFLIIFDPKASIVIKMMAPLGFLLGIGGPLAILTIEVATDEEKIIWLNGINILSLFSGKSIDKSALTLFCG